jgi:hypothetical protein
MTAQEAVQWNKAAFKAEVDRQLEMERLSEIEWVDYIPDPNNDLAYGMCKGTAENHRLLIDRIFKDEEDAPVIIAHELGHHFDLLADPDPNTPAEERERRANLYMIALGDRFELREFVIAVLRQWNLLERVRALGIELSPEGCTKISRTFP